ncbi:MAG: hypothetical protein DRH24_14250 [Deltaproteobacteria bacterium]|nr:MAG: hypothetical protein DRH24_14250 [Deltaproteobacteria bacterium]
MPDDDIPIRPPVTTPETEFLKEGLSFSSDDILDPFMLAFEGRKFAALSLEGLERVGEEEQSEYPDDSNILMAQSDG